RLELVDRDHAFLRIRGADSDRARGRAVAVVRERSLERREHTDLLAVGRALALALAPERALHRRDRDLDLRVVGLARGDLLEEEARPEQHAQRTGRAVARREALQLVGDRGDR